MRGKRWTEVFKDHVATERDGVTRWAKPGTNIDSLNYIVRGRYLFVYGDLGDAIYAWSQEITLEWVAGCNLDYFAGKCQASPLGRDFREFSEEKATQDLLFVLEDVECTERERRDALRACESEHEWHEYLWTDEASKLLGDDCCEYADLGQRISPRCEAHLAGLKCMFGKETE